mmetsp:Transcript_17113/g.46308  ORF Transcript_17113/g.46308 Transcript_17113/m.46308 type:complete len:331 (+) Transcript_17113:54-1046(+)
MPARSSSYPRRSRIPPSVRARARCDAAGTVYSMVHRRARSGPLQRRRVSIVVKSNLRGALIEPLAALWSECAVELVLLLLDCGAKLEQILRDVLTSLAQHILEGAGVGLVMLREKRVGHACLARAPRAPDAVDVVLDGEWECKVDHHLHIWDVEATCSDVRGYKEGHLARLEALERLGALVLRLVAVDGSAVVPRALELCLYPRSLLLVEREDEDPVLAVGVILLEELHQPCVLSMWLQHLHPLLHAVVGRELRRAHGHCHRPSEEVRGELTHALGPGGCEHARLPLRGCLGGAHNGPYVLFKAEIQKAIGLIEHDVGARGEVGGAVVLV